MPSIACFFSYFSSLQRRDEVLLSKNNVLPSRSRGWLRYDSISQPKKQRHTYHGGGLNRYLAEGEETGVGLGPEELVDIQTVDEMEISHMLKEPSKGRPKSKRQRLKERLQRYGTHVTSHNGLLARRVACRLLAILDIPPMLYGRAFQPSCCLCPHGPWLFPPNKARGDKGTKSGEPPPFCVRKHYGK